MNLIYPMSTYPLAQPYYHVNSANKTKLKALALGDSYYMGLWCKGFSDNSFDKGSFWYYNKTIYSNDTAMVKDKNKINIITEIEKHKIVIVMTTDANDNAFGFGFIEEAYSAYFNHAAYLKKLKREQYILTIINNINGTPQWLEKIKQKAKVDNVTIEAAVRSNAEYVVNEENKNTSK